MATYVYETIPAKPGGKSTRFEVRQSMTEPALTKHPETGEPVRRVISGGFGIMGRGAKATQPSGGCGSGACGCC
ncbi:MAG: zinc ribbon domain-containing protein [Terrimicrobiaceae bacterium]|nr:zinc ribbon domain-containing protein [Terrimicrobiaceae bacterium]